MSKKNILLWDFERRGGVGISFGYTVWDVGVGRSGEMADKMHRCSLWVR